MLPFLAGGWLAWALAMPAAQTALAPATTNYFRFGISLHTFTEVNENDALAAIKVWAGTLLNERGLPVAPEPVVLRETADIARALRNKSIDAVSLNTDEYWQLDAELRASPFIGGLNEGRITEEYILLIHQDSQIKQLSDLQGLKLMLLQNSRMCLAPAWIDTQLLQNGLSRVHQFCQVTTVSKLTKAVLPVFFRQSDACLITRRGFKTMCDLNPQLGQRLKVIAASPPLVTTGFVFRSDYTDPLKEKIVTELGRIKDSPAGSQVLNLFQSGSLEAHPISCLDSAFELLALHRRLCAEARGTAPPP